MNVEVEMCCIIPRTMALLTLPDSLVDVFADQDWPSKM